MLITKKSTNLTIILLVAVSCLFLEVMVLIKQNFENRTTVIENSLLTRAFNINSGAPRITIFQTFSPKADVVMIGDSITEAAEWNEIFPQTKIANRGIRADKTNNILQRMKTIVAVNPQKAFIMVGINDINSGFTIDDIYENYTNIVYELQKKNIIVFIQSTLECSQDKCGDYLYKIRKLNIKLREFAYVNNITYIDINDGLTSGKEGLLKEYTYDGVHLLGIGYLKWSRKIAPYINSND